MRDARGDESEARAPGRRPHPRALCYADQGRWDEAADVPHLRPRGRQARAGAGQDLHASSSLGTGSARGAPRRSSRRRSTSRGVRSTSQLRARTCTRVPAPGSPSPRCREPTGRRATPRIRSRRQSGSGRKRATSSAPSGSVSPPATVGQDFPRGEYAVRKRFDGVPTTRAARGARGERTACARGREAAGAACPAAAEREPRRLARASDRRAVGRGAAGDGGVDGAGVRVAAAEGAAGRRAVDAAPGYVLAVEPVRARPGAFRGAGLGRARRGSRSSLAFAARRRWRSGAGRRSPSSSRSRSRAANRGGSRTCASRRWRSGSRPTSRSAATPTSPASWRR